MKSLQASSSEEHMICHSFHGLLYGNLHFHLPGMVGGLKCSVSVLVMDTGCKVYQLPFQCSRGKISYYSTFNLVESTQRSCILLSLVYFLSYLYLAHKAGVKSQGFQTVGLDSVLLFPIMLLLRKTAVYAIAIFHPEFYLCLLHMNLSRNQNESYFYSFAQYSAEEGSLSHYPVHMPPNPQQIFMLLE